MDRRREDWPQWRGPNRDGVWNEDGILETFPRDGLKIRWRAKIGGGYSGPVVARGRVFVTDRQLRPDVERVLCFDEKTGKPLWVHSYPCDYENMEYECGPRAAPTVYQEKAYTLGARGHLFCLDAVNGKILWAEGPREAVRRPAAALGRQRRAAGGRQAAHCYRRRPAGSMRDGLSKGYRQLGVGKRSTTAPPIAPRLAVDAGGQRQVIVWTCETLSSLEPATGKVYWQVPYRNVNDLHVIGTPVVQKDRLLVNSVWRKTAKMLKLDPDKPSASVLWETKWWEHQ